MEFEFRCTFKRYAHVLPEGREGHYIAADSPQDAMEEMARRFPEETTWGFTADLWKQKNPDGTYSSLNPAERIEILQSRGWETFSDILGGVVTTNGDAFTSEDHKTMLQIIHKRFGRKTDATVAAWKRLLQIDGDIDHVIIRALELM